MWEDGLLIVAISMFTAFVGEGMYRSPASGFRISTNGNAELVSHRAGLSSREQFFHVISCRNRVMKLVSTAKSRRKYRKGSCRYL